MVMGPIRAGWLSAEGSAYDPVLVKHIELLRTLAEKQDSEGKGEIELPAREMLLPLEKREPGVSFVTLGCHTRRAWQFWVFI